MTPYEAHKEQEYLKRTGEYDRRKREEAEGERRRDNRLRGVYGEDYPGQYSR